MGETTVDDVVELPLVSQAAWDLAAEHTEGLGLRPQQILAAKIEGALLRRGKVARSQAIDDCIKVVAGLNDCADLKGAGWNAAIDEIASRLEALKGQKT